MSRKINSFEERFFSVIEKNLSLIEIDKLEGMPGFSTPNNFSVNLFILPLKNKSFPSEGFNEYCWAITECFDSDFVDQLDDKFLLLYLTALFMYCNSKEPFGVEYSGLYVAACIKRFGNEELFLLKDFLSFLNKEKNLSLEYFSLLGILFVDRALQSDFFHGDTYGRLCEIIDEKNFFSFEDISYGEDFQYAWSDLNENLPKPCWCDEVNFCKLLFISEA